MPENTEGDFFNNYGKKSNFGNWRRKNLSASLPYNRKNRYCKKREGQKGKTLLFKESQGKKSKIKEKRIGELHSRKQLLKKRSEEPGGEMNNLRRWWNWYTQQLEGLCSQGRAGSNPARALMGG